MIDSCVLELGPAVDRNFVRFPTLGNYVWPAIEPIPETYEEEVANLKTWLIARLTWIDTQWLNDSPCSNPPTDISIVKNDFNASIL